MIARTRRTRTRDIATLASALLTSLALGAPSAMALGPCEAAMQRASARHGVPLSILYAVGMTETGGAGHLKPYAMNANGTSYIATTAAEGLRKLDEFRARGVKLVDLGCMQINHHWHGENFASPLQMFDPERNVDYAARFLAELKQRHGNWTMAAARYNAGPNNDPAQKRYVCAVIRNLVRSGFGSWTPQSRAFCD